MSAVDAAPHVRPARPADLEQLAEIWLDLMLEHEGLDPRFTLASDAEQQWRRMAEGVLTRSDAFLFVSYEATLSGFCLGWIARNPPIYETTDVGFISEIAVAKRVRRRGHGRALVERARRWFSERGLTEFHLATAVWNDAANGFWQAQGGKPLLLRYHFALDT